MGKRPVNCTKGGKFMNPTDQARKFARKRELKRNKKQRQMVRALAMKGKDPKLLVAELESLDAVEYDPIHLPVIAEQTLKEKRKKLMDTLYRIMRFYQREEPSHYPEIRDIIVSYEHKRREKQRYYEAVKEAQRVTVDAIPMPLDMMAPPLLSSGRSERKRKKKETKKPTRSSKQNKSKGILKRPDRDANSNATATRFFNSRVARGNRSSRLSPGPPPGDPPPLDESDDLSEAIARALLREQQLIEAETIVERAAGSSHVSLRVTFKDDALPVTASPLSDLASPRPPQPAFSPLPPLGPPPPTATVFHVLPPTGPPPACESPAFPSLPPPRFPLPRLPLPAIPSGPPKGLPAIPPGPPKGLPPPSILLRLPSVPPPPSLPSTLCPKPTDPILLKDPLKELPRQRGRITALHQRREEQRRRDAATIVATPQLRKVNPEVMRFMPTALKIKREPSSVRGGRMPNTGTRMWSAQGNERQQNSSEIARVKEDAYDEFMKEIDALMRDS